MKVVSFPRVPIEIDFGQGPIQTQFRFTTYAALAIKEKIGPEAFDAFSDAKKWQGLSGMEQFKIVSAFIWGMLLHAHDDIEFDSFEKKLPAGEEMTAIVESLKLALIRGNQPERPTKGPRKAAPKTQRVNGGIENANTAAQPASNSGLPTSSISS